MEYLRESNMELTGDIDIGKLKNAMLNREILSAKALLYEKNVA